ncbi:trypsin-like serine protease, partial [candidate division WWE3 bacterium]|nr:trypsin-like serine protease [candidate division WWE3 bacterium]
MSDNVFRGVVIVTLVAISTCVGFGAYRVLKLDESVEQLRGLDSGSSAVVLPGVPAETKKCEVVEETIITRQNPWESLQPKVKDTVVQIFSQIAAFNWLEPYKTPNHGQAFGSGFLIDEEGHIITNAHVVNEAKAVTIQIPSFGKHQLSVDIIGVSPDRDLALLKLKADDLETVKKELGRVPFLVLGDSDKVKRASEIMTLGYPLGQQSLKSTTGVVSGRESVDGRQYIQIDAPINPGNSGGPSVDPQGKVVGINSAGMLGAQNVGYIIPINELKLVLKDIAVAPNRLLRRPFLGIFYNTGSEMLTKYLGNPQPGGVYVTDVYPGSVLEEAGIKAGDMVYELNGHKVDVYGEISAVWSEDKISLLDYIAFLPLGSEVSIAVYRKGAKKTLKFKFRESKLPAVRVMFPDYEKVQYEIVGGMVVMELCRNLIPLLLQNAPELIRYEDVKNQTEPLLVITHILPDSAAQRSRVLAPGTRIKEINGVEV